MLPALLQCTWARAVATYAARKEVADKKRVTDENTKSRMKKISCGEKKKKNSMSIPGHRKNQWKVMKTWDRKFDNFYKECTRGQRLSLAYISCCKSLLSLGSYNSWLCNSFLWNLFLSLAKMIGDRFTFLGHWEVLSKRNLFFSIKISPNKQDNSPVIGREERRVQGLD